MSNQGVQVPKRRPPESERYDELKGKVVAVALGTVMSGEGMAPIITGVLRWVDRYTIGLEIQGNEIIGKPNQVWIVNKAKIVMLGEA